MANLENLSRFPTVCLHGRTREAAEVLIVCTAVRFCLPPPNRSATDALSLCEEQRPAIVEDVYYGEPGTSSLRHESQTAYRREATDIYLLGHAWTPGARPAQRAEVHLRVGPCQKSLYVVGDRRWHGWTGLRPSEPASFSSMPLRYERAFGGAVPCPEGREPIYEPRNPVGCGLYEKAARARDQPLPNIEDPGCLIADWSDRPVPAGVGPIARNWEPRIGFAGTYDDTWRERRAPLWPEDLDLRFFQAAASGLTATPHLRGGEPVVLSGVSPDGPISFALPEVRLRLKSVFREQVERRHMLLDAVEIEPDEGVLTLIFRAVVPMHRRLIRHVYSVLRELEPWETAVDG